jgi:hypothetical protein
VSLRIRSVLDLPAPMRAYVNGVLGEVRPLSVASAQLRKAQAAEERERLVGALLFQLETVKLSVLFEREYQFHTERKWRLDLYASAPYNLGIEVQGGVQLKGRRSHTGIDGYQRDREKINAAIECGIPVLEYTAQMIADGSALAQIERIMRRS